MNNNSPQVMGILNVTPDSFSDGGQYVELDLALKHCEQMIAEGVDIIDVGGESTRPNAQSVSIQQELDRVIPIIQAIKQRFDITISIDTSKAEVMQAAVATGANFINDVYALRQENALEVAAKLNIPVCLMHMQGEPRTMQQSPSYQNVVLEVKQFLQQRLQACLQAGIAKDKIYLDPGFGFGKTLSHNLLLMQQLPVLLELKQALIIGVSRKSMIAKLLDNAPVEQRLYGGLALASLAIWQGATIIRTHDVKATVDIIKVCSAVKNIK